jgi:hypothetical protein
MTRPPAVRPPAAHDPCITMIQIAIAVRSAEKAEMIRLSGESEELACGCDVQRMTS